MPEGKGKVRAARGYVVFYRTTALELGKPLIRRTANFGACDPVKLPNRKHNAKQKLSAACQRTSRTFSGDSGGSEGDWLWEKLWKWVIQPRRWDMSWHCVRKRALHLNGARLPEAQVEVIAHRVYVRFEEGKRDGSLLVGRDRCPRKRGIRSAKVRRARNRTPERQRLIGDVFKLVQQGRGRHGRKIQSIAWQVGMSHEWCRQV